MTQGLDTLLQTSMDKTVAGFLSAIKAGVQACSAGNSLFASLLDESKANPVTVDPYKPTQAASSNAGARSVNYDTDSEASLPQQQERSASDRSATSPAKAASTEGTQNAKKPQGQDDAGQDQAARAQEDTNNTQDATAQADAGDGQDLAAARAPKDSAKTEDKEEKKETAGSEEIAAYLATLLPLDGKADKKILKTEAEGEALTDAASVAADADEATTAQANALQQLTAIHQDLLNEGREGGESEDAARTKNAVENAVKEIAGKILTLKDAQQVLGDKALTDSDDTVAAGALLDETSGEDALAGADTSSGTKAEGTQTATQKKIQELFGASGRPFAETLQPQDATAKAGLAQAAANAASAASSSDSAGSEAASSTKAATTQNILSASARPLGSYDAAGQLSAARVSKGGAAGLPQMIEQVSVQLNKAAKDGVDTITVQLRPAELGKIEIKLDFASDKSVTGTVTADNQATLTLLQKDSSSLQRALQDAGLDAQAGCLEFTLRDPSGNAGQFAHQNNGQSGTQGHGEGQSASTATDIGTTADALEETGVLETYYLTPGRVNLSV